MSLEPYGHCHLSGIETSTGEYDAWLDGLLQGLQLAFEQIHPSEKARYRLYLELEAIKSKVTEILLQRENTEHVRGDS